MQTYHETIVALFATRDAAYLAKQDLETKGIPNSDIEVRSAEDDTTTTTTTAPAQTRADHEPGFFEWLFGDYDVPEQHRTGYQTAYKSGRTLLAVRVPEGQDIERVTDIIEGHNPININEGEYATQFHDTYADTVGTRDATGVARDTTTTTVHDTAPRAATSTTSAVGTDTGLDTSVERTTPTYAATGEAVTGGETTEERIPVTKEELRVGKRAVRSARAYRIRTSVREVPVEEDVRLRDESVTIERQPHSGVTPEGEAFKERTVEVRETHEEPVVDKVVTGEDIVVKKKATERVETVRDTVKETQVDMDGDKPLPTSTTPSVDRDKL